MLQLTGNAIHENGTAQNMQCSLTTSNNLGTLRGGSIGGSSSIGGWPYTYAYQTAWNNYPVYVTTDRTEKAIKILQVLETKKVIEVKSVKRFIELVEKLKELI